MQASSPPTNPGTLWLQGLGRPGLLQVHSQPQILQLLPHHLIHLEGKGGGEDTPVRNQSRSSTGQPHHSSSFLFLDTHLQPDLQGHLFPLLGLDDLRLEMLIKVDDLVAISPEAWQDMGARRGEKGAGPTAAARVPARLRHLRPSLKDLPPAPCPFLTHALTQGWRELPPPPPPLGLAVGAAAPPK